MLANDPLPDAEAQCRQLAELIRPLLPKNPALVGIYSGGAWIAERLRELLGLTEEIGLIDVSFYRDDFAEKGLHPQVKPTLIPFEVEGRHLVLVDDVLYTGRTTRAAINELFDYGRPAAVDLAVLADRGGRELPVAATWRVWDVALAPGQSLVLGRDEGDQLAWRLEHA
ncbi:bifunctional pyr operon transcriptional regulator/uracil phosphoribosyltransferase PyrR [Azonexus sp.]|uniref:bifunctional pyr operon transcriptional regulator/uracil phosphoribosyltransferase PyrR n=1 Tax=Azonexus sp. TaxID=1872668 RepID=UPI0035B29642